jgi:hypothetical protein
VVFLYTWVYNINYMKGFFPLTMLLVKLHEGFFALTMLLVLGYAIFCGSSS